MGTCGKNQENRPPADDPPDDAAWAIDVTGVTKSFDGRKVVNQVDMRVRRGEIFGFLGPNGSGKTTFMRMLCGLLIPDAGQGRCLGFDVLRQQRLIRERIGYMTQHFSCYGDLTIRENLDFMARLYRVKQRRRKVEDALVRLGLAERQHQLAGTLSGGWKQRLALAVCMIHDPEILLLDEPTAGVDPKARRDFWDEIHKLAGAGITVLITTHYMDEAERCHRMAYLAYGNILARGTSAEVIAQAGLTTWRVEGPDLAGLAARLKQAPGVEQVAAFGARMHVSGSNADLLRNTVAEFDAAPYVWGKIAPGLEDVFIHLMAHSKDNMAS